MMVRAFFDAVQVETAVSPYNHISLKIYYPAAPTGSDVENMTGVIPADSAHAPFPVVIFMPGINVGIEAYHWLATRLVKDGLVVVVYQWIAEEMPGYISVSPGVDLTAIHPDSYGTTATCPALAPILAKLAILNSADPASSRLAGLLDLDNIILGGHSAGGTMALQSVHPDWFPQVKGAFTYGAHTMASTMLGFEPGTILPIFGKRPLLIMGGEKDGVIEASTRRYGIDGGATVALERTFDEAASGGRNDQFLLILTGANHFSMVWPLDETTGRPFLDHPTERDAAAIRSDLAAVIKLFIEEKVLQRSESGKLSDYIDEGNGRFALSRQK